MDKNLKIAIFLGIVVSLFLAIGWVFLGHDNLLTDDVSKNAAQDWKVYKNSSIGLQFKVPADWSLLSVGSEGGYEIGQTNPRNSIYIYVTGVSEDTKTAESSYKKYERYSNEIINGYHSWQINDLRMVSVAGLDGIVYENDPGMQPRKKSMNIFKGDKLLRIVYSIDESSNEKDVLDKIVSTAKFSDLAAEGDEPVIVQKIGPSGKEIFLEDLHFVLPDDWIAEKIENGKVHIKDLSYETEYEVFLVPIRIFKTAADISDAYMWEPVKINGGRIAEQAIGGTRAAYTVELNGFYYDITFDIAGNEPIPGDAGGVWRPSNGFTDDEIEEMMMSVSIVF